MTSEHVESLLIVRREVSDALSKIVGPSMVPNLVSVVMPVIARLRVEALAAERARVVALVTALHDAVPKKYEGGKLNHDWSSYHEGAADALDDALQALDTAAASGPTTEGA